jgi:hypothetical protein
MFSIVLFVFYCILFCWGLTKIKFVSNSGLHKNWIISFFLIKVVAGCVYGYIHYKSNYGVHTDTWKFYYQSLPETAILKTNPINFFKSLFSNGYGNTSGGVMDNSQSYWNDLKGNIMIMLMSFGNLLSGTNYYINCIFLNFITFFGCITFYRFCLLQFKLPKIILIFISFLLPSTLFWGSGFHKEGLIFTAISFCLYSCYKIMYGKKYVLSSLLFALSLLTILLFRGYILLLLIPFLFVWILFNYYDLKRKLLFNCTTAILFILLFFNMDAIVPQLNLPKYTSNVQVDFIALQANSKVQVDSLYPTATSFLHNLPKAIDVAFLRPHITEVTVSYLPSLIENFFCIALLLLSIFFFYKKAFENKTVCLFLFFSIFCMIFLGFTVPITGAIIRYKSIFMPFLLIALIGCINWNKVNWLPFKK